MEELSDRTQYWNEISLIEDLRAFHPEAFDALTARQKQVLRTYYALNVDIADVYEYKKALDRQAPLLASEAAKARRVFMRRLRVKNP